METTPIQPLEMTADLCDYVRATAFDMARKRCPPSVNPEDVAQECVLKLIAKPPKFDPSRGAKPKTLLYTCVVRIVSDYLQDERKEGQNCIVDANFTANDPNRPEDQRGPLDREENRRVALRTRRGTKVDILQFIDSEESRRMCELFLECKGNVSEVGRRLGLSEATIRSRLKMLAKKLRAAGFDPFPTENTT